MDLSDIQPHERTLEIKHPATGEALGLTLTIVPLENDRVKMVKRQHQDRAIRGGVTSEDIERNTLEILAATIINWSWDGDLTWNGKKPDYSNANVVAVLKSKNGPFIIRQLDKALGDEAGFFAA